MHLHPASPAMENLLHPSSTKAHLLLAKAREQPASRIPEHKAATAADSKQPDMRILPSPPPLRPSKPIRHQTHGEGAKAKLRGWASSDGGVGT